MIEVSGKGVLSLLDRAVVYPEGMPHPAILERTFTDARGGAILRQLLLEAQQRGCLAGVVLDWSADADTLGNPFEDKTTISFHAGTPLSQVATKLSEGMGLFDLEMTPTLHLKLYKAKGTDKYDAVKYRPGQAIVKHQNQSDSSRMTNTLLVEGESGSLIETAHPTSQMDWGRREGYLQARNIPSDWAKLQDYGQLFLKGSAQVSWGIQGTVVKFIDSEGNKLKPFESFMLGDWIGWYIPPEGSDTEGFDGKVRVKGITCEEDESGALSYVLELNNIMLEHEIRMNQLVERMSMFTQNSSLSTPATESPAGVSHNHTHSMLLGLDSDDHPQYYNEDRHAADTHSAISRVASLKTSGANALTGDVTLVAGSNVSFLQNNDEKTITIAASGGGSTGGSKQWYRCYAGNSNITLSTSSYLTKGFVVEPLSDLKVWGLGMVQGESVTNTIALGIYELNGTTQVGAPIVRTANINGQGVAALLIAVLSQPVTLSAGKRYVITASNTTAGATLANSGTVAYPATERMLWGLRHTYYARINKSSPAAGDVWEVATSSSPFSGALLIEQ